jgi:hypothetical protein
MYEFYFFSLFLVIITIISIINLYLITDILDKKINYYSLNFMLFLNFSSPLLFINYYEIFKLAFKKQLYIYEILNSYEFIMNNIFLIILLIQSCYFIDEITDLLEEGYKIYYLNLLTMIGIIFSNLICNIIIIISYYVYKFNINNFQYTNIV